MYRPGSGLTARRVLSLLSEVEDGGALSASAKAALAADDAPPRLPPPDPATPAGRRRIARRLRGWDEQYDLLAEIRDAVFALATAGKFTPYPRPGDAGRPGDAYVAEDLDDVPPGF